MALGILLLPQAASGSQRNQDALQNEECVVCLATVQELGAQARFTSCCKKCVCAKDFDSLEAQAREQHRNNGGHRHARCPHCRHYPLKIKAVAAPAVIRQAAPSARPIPSAPPLHELPESTHDQTPHNIAPRTDVLELDSAVADQQLQHWLSQQANAKRCPTPGCSFAFINERAPNPHGFKCPACDCSYCSSCLIDHESDISCQTAALYVAQLIHKQLERDSHQLPAQSSPVAAVAEDIFDDLQAGIKSLFNRVCTYLKHE